LGMGRKGEVNAVKAWAFVYENDGRIDKVVLFTKPRYKRYFMSSRLGWTKVVRVEIRELPKKGKKK